MATTKKPTGLAIARNGEKFTCTWKIGDNDYGGGQQAQYSCGGQWINFNQTSDIDKKTTSKTATVDFSRYGSHYLEMAWVAFRVRGNRKKYTEGSGKKKKTINPGWSDWAEKTFDINKPHKPSVSAELDSAQSNKTTFNVSCTKKADDHKPVYKLEYKTALVEGCNHNDGSKVAYGASTKVSGTTSGDTVTLTQTYTEDSSIIKSGKSYTRWFAVRSCGIGGDSEWVYAKHVYAMADKAQNVRATAQETESGFTCSVAFSTSSSNAKPVDDISVQYTITTPDAGLTCPSGVSWTDADNIAYKDGTDTVRFSVDDKPSKDECLFVRVNTRHDSFPTYGSPVLVSTGGLKAPTNIQISPDDTTHTVTVELDHASAVDDSFVAVRYIPNSQPDKPVVIGVIPYTETSLVSVKCPDWSEETTYTFDLFAMVGSYTRKTYTTGIYCYELNDKFSDKPMRSPVVRWANGDVPKAPSSVTVEQTSITGTARVAWDWTWDTATGAELAWADHEDAWESTDEPSKYTISNNRAVKWNVSGLDTGKEWFFRVRFIKESKDNTVYSQWSEMVSIVLYSEPPVPTLSLSSNIISTDESVVASWSYPTTDGTKQAYAEVCDIADVNNFNTEYVVTTDTSLRKKDYYARSGSGTSQSPYVYKVKDLKTYTLTSDSTAVAGHVYYNRTGSGTAADPYVYSIVDNPSGSVSSYYHLTDENPSVNPSSQGLYELNRRIIARVSDMMHVSISAEEAGWKAGETHNIAVRVVSTSGKESNEWSNTKPLIITVPLVCTVTATSLVTKTVPEDDEEETTRSVLSLTQLPLTVTVTGAGADGITSLVIERADAYHIERPDENVFNGFEGEAIYVLPSRAGEGQISISKDDLIGPFDDGARYRIIATVRNGYGQTASADPIEFEVHWTHQALVPSADVSIDLDLNVAFITPIAPSGALSTDRADIYRLSADKPQLIYQGAEFGEMYVDPYPALGEFGGHRIVFRTAEGDYITADNEIAWANFGIANNDNIDLDCVIINFDGYELRLDRNVDVAHSWEKDFKETRYLGGSIQGDWNEGVGRTTTINAVAISIRDQDTLQIMRRLVTYTGLCHVRTPDGSSFTANVEAEEEHTHKTGRMVVTYSLKITRVDPQRLDGQTYAEWSTGLLRSYAYNIYDGDLYETAEEASGNTFSVSQVGNLIWSPGSEEGISFRLDNGHLIVDYEDDEE